MSNPYIFDTKPQPPTPASPTGEQNPYIISEVAQLDSLVGVFGKKAAQGFLELPSAGLNTFARLVPSLAGVAQRFDKYVHEDLEPTLSPNDRLGEGLGYVGGEVLGNMLGGGLAQAGAKGGIKLGLRLIPNGIAAKGVAATAKIADSIAAQVLAKTGSQVGAQLAKFGVQQAPMNIAAQGVVQGVTDPSSLTTPSGIGQGIAMSMLGSLMDARSISAKHDQVIGMLMNRLATNPLDIETKNLLAKVAADPSEVMKIRLPKEIIIGNPLKEMTGENRKRFSELLGTINPTLPAHTQRILERFAPPTTTGRWWEVLNQMRKDPITAFIDRYHPGRKEDIGIAKREGIDELPQERSIKRAADFLSSVSSVTDRLINGEQTFIHDETGAPIYTGRPTLKKLLEYRIDENGVENGIKTVEDLKRMNALVAARHTVDMEKFPGSPVKTGIDIFDAEKEIATADPRIARLADGYSQFLRDIYDFGVNEKLFSREYADKLYVLNPNFMSLSRSFDDPSIRGKLVQHLDSKRVGANRVFQERTGNEDLLIKDPILTATANARMIVQASLKNKVGLAILDNMEVSPQAMKDMGNYYVQAQPLNDLNDITRRAKSLLESNKGIKENLTVKEALHLASIFNPMDDSGVLTIWKNGVEKKLRVSDNLLEMYHNMQPQEMSVLFKMLGIPAQMLKTGITHNPIFSVFNGIRDSFEATLKSQNGFRLGIDSWNGFKESLFNTQTRKDWLAAGGGFNGITARINDSEIAQVASILPKLIPDETIMGKFKVSSALEVLRKFASPFEEAARLGEHMLALKNGKTMTEAVLSSKNITTDFSKIGAQMRALSHITAFLNPAIQSTARDAETALMMKKFSINGHDFNYPTLNNKTGLGFAAKGVAGITIPTILLWAANHGDTELDDIRKGPAGNLYWFTKIPGTGEIVKIPKPFLAGQVFGTSIEQALDRMFDNDPQTMTQFKNQIIDAAAPTIIPTAAQVVTSLWANKDTYTGMPIVPAGQQNVDPRYQNSEYTSPLAKGAANVINNTPGVSSLAKLVFNITGISPFQIDYTIKALGGGLGEEVGKTSRLFDKDKAAIQSSDFPVVGKMFARYPSRTVQPVRDFYDGLQKAELAITTMKFLERTDPSKLESFIHENVQDIATAPIYTGARERLNVLQSTLSQLQSIPHTQLDGNRKRELEDTIIRQMIEMTRQINHAVKGVNIQ